MCSLARKWKCGEDGFDEVWHDKACTVLVHNRGVRFRPMLLHCYTWQCSTFKGLLVHDVLCRFCCPRLPSARRDVSIFPFPFWCRELVEEGVLKALHEFILVSWRSIGSNRRDHCPNDGLRGFGWREIDMGSLDIKWYQYIIAPLQVKSLVKFEVRHCVFVRLHLLCSSHLLAIPRLPNVPKRPSFSPRIPSTTLLVFITGKAAFSSRTKHLSSSFLHPRGMDPSHGFLRPIVPTPARESIFSVGGGGRSHRSNPKG